MKKVDKKMENEIKERGHRIRLIRNAIRYSTRKFEANHGVNASTIKNWESGRGGGLTADGALKLIDAFRKEGIDCTLEWLLYGKGVDPISSRQNKVNLESSIYTAEAATPESAIVQELRLFHQLNPGAIDTIVSDDAMLPLLTPGDYVAGIRCFDDEISELVGLYCIVQLQAGPVVVRQLMPGVSADQYRLLANNPNNNDYADQDIKLFSAAKILWIRKPK